MKRAVTSFLSILLLASVSVNAMATSLAPSDRITAHLADIQRREDEIEQQRAQQQSNQNAAYVYGVNSDDTNDLSYYINRKILTKAKYEAFKWSFIFSQFAKPLEDSYIDIINSKVFQSMLESNLTIEGVQEYIITNSTGNAANDKIAATMFQTVSFPELIETMQDNYAVFPLFDENGSIPTLDTILNAKDALSVFDKFYIYDTRATTGTTIDEEQANALFYNQYILADDNVTASITGPQNVKYPIFVYDAMTFMYLQFAVGSYCLANGCTVADLSVAHGSDYLCIDTYGNICVRTSSSNAVILLPNFGNPFLTAVVGDNSELSESINFYNKWITTLYSEVTRSRNTIYPTHFTVTPFGSQKPVYKNDGTVEYEEMDVKSDHYSTYLAKHQGDSLRNSILLVEQSAPSAHPSNALESNVKFSASIPYSTFSGDFYSSIDPSTIAPIDLMNDTIMHPDDTEYTSVNFISYLLNVIQAKGKQQDIFKYQEKNSDQIGGFLLSSYNVAQGIFGPFTATSNSDVFKNKNAFYQYYIDIAQQGDNIKTTTHYARFGNTMKVSKWRINGSTYFSSVGSSNSNDATNVLPLADLCTVICNFGVEQCIPDTRFMSWYNAAMDDGTSRTELYIPKENIDVGQNMSAYLNDEKGMFLAEYAAYFSDNMTGFREFLQVSSNIFFDTINAWTVKDNKRLIDGNKKVDAFDDTGLADKEKRRTISYISSTPTVQIINHSWFNDTLPGADPYFELTFSNPDSLLSQDTLAFLYNLDSPDNATHNPISKVNVYVWYDIDDEGNITTEWNKNCIHIGPRGNPEENECYEYIGTYYFLNYDGVQQHFHYNGSDLGIAEAEIFIALAENYLKDEVDLTNCDTNNEIFEAYSSKLTELVDSIQNYICAFSGAKPDGCSHFSQSIDTDYLPTTKESNVLASDKAIKAILLEVADALKYFAYSSQGSIKSFNTLIDDISYNLNIDHDRLYLMLCAFAATWQGAGPTQKYIYDEYVYLMRNPTYLSGTMGCNDSDDFATVTYFWDRHYLTTNEWNQEIPALIEDQWGLNKNDKLQKILADYNKYLHEIGKTSVTYPISKYMEEYGASYNIWNGNAYEVYTPMYYEYALQGLSFEEYLLKESEALVEHENEKTGSSSGNKSNNSTGNSGNSAKTYFSSSSNLYNYLHKDTIIVYPFTTGKKYKMVVHGGAANGVLDYSASARSESSVAYGTIEDIDILGTIMALQCNTDYKNNALAVLPTSKPEVTHVTKEELMDNANQFFTNPVTSLSYILSGFAYQIHATFATGDLGSVFNIGWLLETDIYQWIINRYAAIITIAVAVLLFIKLIQLAMSKSRDFLGVVRDLAGVFALALVPLIIFNSFVWIFNFTSEKALHGTTNKILLSQIDVKSRERINNDARVSAELNAFKEQFSSIEGSTLKCLNFEEMTDYTLTNGPTYKFVGIWDYMDKTNFTMQKDTWYSSEGFVPVHQEYYDESLYYFFYDYIKSEYISYAKANLSNYISDLNTYRTQLQASNTKEDAAKKITLAEQTFNMMQGNFRAMLEDTRYVYGKSIEQLYEHQYDGPKVKDLVGLYYVFGKDYYGTSSTYSFIKNITESPYYTAYKDTDLLKADDRVYAKMWTDQSAISDYIKNESDDSNKTRGATTANRYPVFTSYHDIFNTQLNNIDTKGLTIDDIIITPLEEKLCALSEDIYDTTLQALSYLPTQVHDEAAINLMAMIATCKVNEAFGFAPAEPILQSVTLDSFVRTAFLTNLADVGSDKNTMYAMINQGDSIGKIILVLFLELIISLSSICRVLIILYITLSSFIILGLRIIHKAPRTSELAYGIIGNMLALLALHGLTLFLVIVAIEAIAGATSVIPSLLLDILMIAFVILVVVLLVMLVKNIAMDALNIGGAKIRGMVHSIGDSLINAVQSVVHAGSSSTSASDVALSANSINQTINLQEQTSDLLSIQSNRVASILDQMEAMQADDSIQEEQRRANPQNTRIEQNIDRESSLFSEDNS